MASLTPSVTRSGFGVTSRRDTWWIKPLLVFLGLSAFIIYSTWAAFQAAHYWHGPLLSPFYSPELFGAAEGVESGHAWFGPKPGWLPDWLPWSPAFLILWAPAGFRLTCYYYRGAYYKAFWADPPACAVSEPRNVYLGENSLPLILQNVHRYFMYIAVVFLVFLAIDVWHALWWPAASGGGTTLGLSVGTLVLTLNVILLGGYTLGCHSFRHVVGGFVNVFSKNPMRHKAWKCVTCLNVRHQLFAWMSLFWVGFTDFYVRMCSHGTWSDWRIF